MNRLLLTAAFGVLVLVEPGSAGEAKKTPDKAMSDYYPLQVGNRWEYDLIAGGKTVTMVNRIGKIETIDNVPLTVLEATLNDKLIATEHLRHTDKGLLRHRINQFAPEPPLVLLRYPAKAGDQWEGEFKIGAAKATYACRTQEETVEVPAGKFKAIRVNIQVDESGKVVNTSYWFVREVGVVKQSIEINGMNIVMELRKFEPKQRPAKQ